MMAVSSGNVTQFRVVMGQALSNLEPLEAVQDVVAPVLREIGERWVRGSVSIGLEHALSAVTKQLLMSSLNAMRWTTGGPSVTIATPSGELHEIGALLAHFLAASCGADSTYLGPNMPVDALSEAVGALNSQVLVLSVIRERPDADMTKVMHQIAEEVPTVTEIWLGLGAHASLRTQNLPRRITVFGTYEPFLTRLTAAAKTVEFAAACPSGCEPLTAD